MSKNVEKLLSKLGVADVAAVYQSLMSDDENETAIESVLKTSQTYSRPFIEGELNERFKSRESQFKGRYLKEALMINNKIFGTPLTTKEIEEVLKDPENTGQTYDKAMELMKEKVTQKTGATDSELQKMLDVANSKITDYEERIPKIQEEAETKARERIDQFKLDGVVDRELIRILDGKTAMPAHKVAKLIKGQLTERALLRLKDDGNIGLFKLGNADEMLKRNDTSFHTLDTLVEDLIVENEIPTKKSQGTTKTNIVEGGNGGDPAPKGKPATGATGLAAKIAQLATS